MWKAARSSVIGSSHLAAGTQCEDACDLQMSVHGHMTAMVLSDGAGSAKFGKEGAQLVVSYLSEHVITPLLDGVDSEGTADRLIYELTEDDARGWVKECHCKLSEEATKVGTSIGEFSATMLLAILGANRAV